MFTSLLLFVVCFNVDTVGIMGAMDMELELIQNTMVVDHIDTIAGRFFTVGTLEGVPCICVKAGIGKVNAALTASILISHYDIDAVIFTGVAGGINPDLSIGGIVISERVIHHDYGEVTPDAFMPWDTVGYLADSTLIALTSRAAARVRYKPVPEEIAGIPDRLPSIIVGTVVTGDQFIASEEKRQWLEAVFKADCVEMEGAAVAQVCVINKVPFVIIRSLSDLANETADVDFTAFARYASENSAAIVREILKILNQ
jgi:adenosylhomocysteine nucleosidase